jgi:site-specific DNA-methyltransferase (cytosine-N4-specific)
LIEFKTNDIIEANALEELPFEDGFFRCAITSPPYWGLRAYGDDPNEIGAGDLADYIEQIVTVMGHVAGCLDDRGTLWLNIGDTASGSGGAGGDYNKGGNKDGRPKWKQGESGMPKQTWCNVPGKVRDALVADGWLCRAEIVWAKGQEDEDPENLSGFKMVERRESLDHVRRPRPSHEMIYMLTRSMDYDFHHDRLTETGTVWHFPPSRAGGRGQAPFPEELPRRCILASTNPGDWVLDPFAGSGTTLDAAGALGRNAVGIDLYAGVADETEPQ